MKYKVLLDWSRVPFWHYAAAVNNPRNPFHAIDLLAHTLTDAETGEHIPYEVASEHLRKASVSQVSEYVKEFARQAETQVLLNSLNWSEN